MWRSRPVRRRTYIHTCLVESRTLSVSLRARGAPPLGSGICLEGCRYRQRGRIFVLEGRLSWREGTRRYLLRNEPSRAERTFVRARVAPSRAEQAPHLLRMAWKMKPFCRQKGASTCGRAPHLHGRHQGKWRFWCQKGAFTGGRTTISVLKCANKAGAFPRQEGVFAGGRATTYA